MSFLEMIIIGFYLTGLTAIFIFTLAQSHLTYHYLRDGKRNRNPEPDWTAKDDKDYPLVTVQLPIYNEKYVVNRLISAVSRFQWPKDKMEIQVLDDSTDETVDIIADKVKELHQHGFQIHHIRRSSREGYKAGALQHGLEKARGAFIAIFDADFVPKPDFLLKTVPYFEDQKIGMVQTRWGHLNRDYSLLTKAQAFALNAHFTVEQAGRNSAGYFMNFNGTAGVWRTSCIKDAGGWQHDTLTEDLDLSYRAQLKGWNFRYLENVVSPAELPVTVSALKSQQYRWMKGAAETARKHLFNIWRNSLSLPKKIQASSHLLSSGIFLFILIISLSSLPLLFISAGGGEVESLLKLFGFFLSGLLLWIIFYSLPLLKEDGSVMDKIIRFTCIFPLFISISMGLSVHNSIAVIKGYAGKRSPFTRTPKFNITRTTDTWKTNQYLVNKLSFTTLLEGLLMLLFLGGIIAAIAIGDISMVLFHMMLFFGFALLFGHAVYEKLAAAA